MWAAFLEGVAFAAQIVLWMPGASWDSGTLLRVVEKIYHVSK